MARYNLVPPSKGTVDFLYKGCVIFYPFHFFSKTEAEQKPIHNKWSGFRRFEFEDVVLRITNSPETSPAVSIIKSWKYAWEHGLVPNANIPQNLDDLLGDLDRRTRDPKYRPGEYDLEVAKKKVLLEQQRYQEKSQRKPPRMKKNPHPQKKRQFQPLQLLPRSQIL